MVVGSLLAQVLAAAYPARRASACDVPTIAERFSRRRVDAPGVTAALICASIMIAGLPMPLSSNATAAGAARSGSLSASARA
jgi:hypothetical protein